MKVYTMIYVARENEELQRKIEQFLRENNIECDDDWKDVDTDEVQYNFSESYYA